MTLATGSATWLDIRRTAALGLCAAALLWAAAATAQAPLSCTPANQGEQVCQAQGVCKCVYSAGGTMMREPPGYRWDCSLLYGKCAPGASYPALAMMTTPGPQATAPGRGTAGQVRAAQSELARLGYRPGPVDGVIGPRTTTAIKAFQRAQQLPESGSLTPETLGRLRIAG
jgi:hypothetical protein